MQKEIVSQDGVRSSASADGSDVAALFFDVDGTLIWIDEDEIRESGARFDSYLPNASVYEAFERLHERGHLTFLCTGRPLALVPEELRKLGFTGYVAGAGSCVAFGDEIVYERFIPEDLLRETVERLLRIRETVLLESRIQPVILSVDRQPVPQFASIPVAGTIEEVAQYNPGLLFSKISSMGFEGWQDEDFRAYSRQHFVECNMGIARELTLPGVDKASGIRRALEYMGRDLRNTYAFGDSENDLPMFEVVETPVAMGNAMPELKERAAFVTRHAKDDGIAYALEHFGLI